MKKIILIGLLGLSMVSAKTFTDNRTGLMWQDDKTSKMTHQKAVEYCKNLSGYNDWRLPNVDELKSIVDYTRTPAIIEGFENTESSDYWTSTRCGCMFFCVVTFGKGNDSWDFESQFVRCVRQ
jgi:hypothetical protein